MGGARFRRRTRAWWIALVVLVLVALAAHPAAAEVDPPTSESEPAPAAEMEAMDSAPAPPTADDWTRVRSTDVGVAAGTFTVAPATGLAYATTVTVTASGYPPGGLFGALECVAGATEIGDCAGTTLVIGTVDPTGAYRGTTTVRRFVTTTTGTVDCAAAPGTCVMAGGPSFADAVLDTHPLAFDPRAPIPPPPTITVSPDSGLGLETEVRVTGSNFDPDGTAAILQCVAGTIDFAACGQSEYAYAEANATGHISTTVLVRRGIRTADDPVVDCAQAPGCELVAFDPADPTRLARAALTFDPTVPLPPPPDVVVDPSTGLADRQLVAVAATGFAPGQVVYLGQCAAGSDSLQTCGNVQTRAADPTGAVAATIRVRRVIGGPPIDCAAAPGTCVAFAAATDDVFATGSVPLTFDPDAPPIPPPSVAVDPTVGLQDGQSVEVTGSGFTPGEQVALIQCRAGPSDETGQSCDLPATLEYRTADASGAVHTTFTVRRVLQTQRFGAVDCARDEPGCIIGWAGLSDIQYERGQVAIRFGPTDGGGPPAPPAPPAPGADPAPPVAGSGPPIATTGAHPAPTVALGLTLVLIGATCVLLARRRRDPRAG